MKPPDDDDERLAMELAQMSAALGELLDVLGAVKRMGMPVNEAVPRVVIEQLNTLLDRDFAGGISEGDIARVHMVCVEARDLVVRAMLATGGLQ